MNSNSFLVKSLGFSTYSSMSYANRDSFTFFFSNLDSVYFSCVIGWLGVPNLCRIKMLRGHSLLVSDFRGNAFNFSPLRIMFAVGLSYIAFIMLSMFLLFLFYGVFFFYHKWMLNFIKSLFCIYWDDNMVFIFQFVNIMHHIDWFLNNEKV